MRFIFSLLITLCVATGTSAQFAGRYTDGKDYAVYFEQTKYGLTIRPVIWTATQLLRADGADRFIVVDRTSRGAEFKRDAGGKVVGVSIFGMDGEGLDLRRADGPPLPIEMFVDGRVNEAVRGYKARGAGGQTAAVEAAAQVLHRLPTKTKFVVDFLRVLEPDLSSNARFHSIYGFALVKTGNRPAALAQFEMANKLDATDEDTQMALRILKAAPTGKSENGWTIPFPISAVFAKPTSTEIASVAKDWATRDLKPVGIKEELRSRIKYDNFSADVRVISHLVHGFRHYGVIIIPDGAKPASMPIIVEAKGVSPTYFPLTLENLTAPAMMGDIGNRFIYVVPTFRGERFELDGKTFTSDGDRTDALDGATDDTIALLSVALQITPEADSERICVFGRSRGGTVAMLTGIRDKSIDCVVNWSGPTDWFHLMDTEGWTEEEMWADALRMRAKPTEPGGQNVERFLSKAIADKADLDAVRHNMIASSPLYFAARLPLSQHHYGLEDHMVPTINGYEMVDQLRKHNVPSSRYQAFFYPGQGHDTDRLEAPVKSREFISTALGVQKR
jgi:hypothetical protein